MALLAQTGPSVGGALNSVIGFLPKLAACIAILVVGYLVARLLQRVVGSLLERIGFARLVERSGVQRTLSGTDHDAAGVLTTIVFYGAMLFVLQLAFGIFGPNPISQLLHGLIAFLPRLFVAVVIVVVAAAIAAGVRDLVRSLLGGVGYGDLLATIAYAIVLGIGIFAALDQLAIAPRIVTGLFYALLAIIVGVAVVAIGGGGIAPMRARWERALDRLDEESPRMRASVQEERARREAEEQRQREEEERARREEQRRRRAEAQAEKQRRAEQQVIRSTPPPGPIDPADEDTAPQRRRDSETDPTLAFDPDETQAIRRPDDEAVATTEDVPPTPPRRHGRQRSEE